jgi:putative hydrolase of HD superfamily
VSRSRRSVRSAGRPRDLLEFFAVAGRLKSQPRRGWVLKLGTKDPESVADHSYRTALMAMVYSDARGLDTARVLKMALIHDLAEARVGDITPGEIPQREKIKREAAAIQGILDGLPEASRSDYLEIWRDFNRGQTPEARLVRQIDKLEMAVQASEYEEAGPRTRAFFRTARAALEDGDLLDLFGLLSARGRVRAGRRAGS